MPPKKKPKTPPPPRVQAPQVRGTTRSPGGAGGAAPCDPLCDRRVRCCCADRRRPARRHRRRKRATQERREADDRGRVHLQDEQGVVPKASRTSTSLTKTFAWKTSPPSAARTTRRGLSGASTRNRSTRGWSCTTRSTAASSFGGARRRPVDGRPAERASTRSSPTARSARRTRTRQPGRDQRLDRRPGDATGGTAITARATSASAPLQRRDQEGFRGLPEGLSRPRPGGHTAHADQPGMGPAGSTSVLPDPPLPGWRNWQTRPA